jgi:hypothetical protein
VLCGGLVLVVLIKQHDAELAKADREATTQKADQQARLRKPAQKAGTAAPEPDQEPAPDPNSILDRPPIELPEFMRKKPGTGEPRKEGPAPKTHSPEIEEESPFKPIRAVPAVDPVEIPKSPKPPVAGEGPPSKEVQQLVEKCVKTVKAGKTAERLKALETLGGLGVAAKGARRALCDTLLDTSLKIRAAGADALEEVDPTLHHIVIPLLVDKDVNQRTEAVERLRKLGVEGRPALPVLLHFRQQYGGGATVIEALAAIACDDKSLTAQFAGWLIKDTDASSRLAIAVAIGGMAGAKQHVNTLASVLQNDSEEEVRAAAAKALGTIGPDAKTAVKALKIAKIDAAAPVREAADQALKQILGEH